MKFTQVIVIILIIILVAMVQDVVSHGCGSYYGSYDTYYESYYGYYDCQYHTPCENRERRTLECDYDSYHGPICIRPKYMCDGWKDCYNGADEYNCECSAEQFACTSGGCVSVSDRCDGKVNCEDKSDELNCECDPVTQFACVSGGCIPLSQRCNGQRRDCFDNSDEVNCSCSSEEFQCEGAGCILLAKRCDGVPDCDYDLDEKYCPCGNDDFRCVSGQCIANIKHCNGWYDCTDRSDEKGCVCTKDQFQCDSGGCIDKQYQCDRPYSKTIYNNDVLYSQYDYHGVSWWDQYLRDAYYEAYDEYIEKFYHCEDKSDESYCSPSPYSPFRCSTTKGYARLEHVCDGNWNCVDGSDEMNCKCNQTQFQCGSGGCIDKTFLCDGKKNCHDFSDENKCKCKRRQFKCESGEIKCIPITKKCDKRNDCIDASDEFDCKYHQQLRCYNYFPFKCNKTGGCYSARERCDGYYGKCEDRSDEIGCDSCKYFTCDNGECARPYFFCQYPDSRRYTCTDNSHLKYNCSCKDKSGTEVYNACDNGQTCYNHKEICNGVYTCSDGTDEQNCLKRKLYCSSSYDFKCTSGQCIDKKRRCDGHADCHGRSDEKDCVCSTDEFACDSGGCISMQKRCDWVDDCDDRSDEKKCDVGVPGVVIVEDGVLIDLDEGESVKCKQSSSYKTNVCVKGNCITGTCEEIVAAGKKYKKRLCKGKKKKKCCASCK